MKNLIIRQELFEDGEYVCNLIKKVFNQALHSDGDEHNLVERLRQGKAFIPELSLVSILDNKIVGHIMFTKLKVDNTTQLALAPLTVETCLQKQGIGTSLIDAGHNIARKMGYEYSILLGDPAYYSRFGYKPSIEFNIICPFDVPKEYFMAIKLQGKTTFFNAKVEYPKEFLI